MSGIRIEFNMSGSWRSGPDLPQAMNERDIALEKAVELAQACGCNKLRTTFLIDTTRVVQTYWTPERGWHRSSARN